MGDNKFLIIGPVAIHTRQCFLRVNSVIHVYTCITCTDMHIVTSKHCIPFSIQIDVFH